jgi:hypothetical protein
MGYLGSELVKVEPMPPGTEQIYYSDADSESESSNKEKDIK